MIEFTYRTLVFAIMLIVVQACSSNATRDKIDEPAQSGNALVDNSLRPIPLLDRIVWPSQTSVAPVAEKLYTYSAKNIGIDQALKLFGKAYQLNLVIDQDVRGNINVEFHNLSFDQAMSALLDAHGYYWQRQDNLVRVRSIETRHFTIDYIRLVRSGSGSSQAQVSSGSSEDSSGGDSGSTAGAMLIEQTDKVDFWDELEKQLKVLVSKDGRLVINRLAGTIQVTDQHRRVEEIKHYIEQLNRSIYRQVDIEVKIVEVTLSDDFSLGIDWTRVDPLQPGRNRDVTITNIVTQPFGGITALDPSVDFIGTETNDDGTNKYTAVLNALKEQGEVNIVSQPRIRTLNNQSALIKVGTDRTFFRKEQQTDTTSAGASTASTDVPQVVTEGIVLAITPQISMDGWITMDVSPAVTRISGVVEVKDADNVVLSSAPDLDISQTSSLVRARNGETIVIGGLIQNQKSETIRAIPWLHRIPGLGHFFKGTYETDVQRELVMFVTPRLIDDAEIIIGKAIQP